MKLAKSQIFIIVINSILFLIGFVLMFSFSVNASSPSTLPYNVNSNSIYNSIMLVHVQDAVDKVYDYYDLSSSDSVIVWTSQGFFRNSFYEYYVMVNPSLMIGHNYTDSYDYSSNVIYLKSDKQICRYVYRSDNLPAEFSASSGVYAQVCGSQTSVSTSIGSFLPMYPFFYNGNDIVFSPTGESSSNVVVITNYVPYEPSIPLQGHATQPTNNPNNFINGNNNLPITKPTFPTINYYTYTTYSPPSIDTTNVESILESIYDLIEYNLDYQTSNFVGQWSNLLNNMGYLTDYIVKSIENGFNKVVLSIQDMTTDLYNNFVSLFEPITTQINYIVSPIDTDFIVSGISETEFYNGFEDTKDFFYTVDTIFDIEEPDHFIIEIHLEDLDFFDTGLLDFNLSTVYLNLGSNILPFRNALRVFLWCMVSVGTVFYVQKNLPSMIKGDEVGGTGDAK